MIKKVVEITKDAHSNDIVELNWFDMQKPNLSAVSNDGVSFIIKVKFTHLHENDVLVCEDGYGIKVKKAKDILYEIVFKDHLQFAQIAYDIGNRHQPIQIEDYKITILDDISLEDIVKKCQESDSITIKKYEGYFKPSGKAHHSH